MGVVQNDKFFRSSKCARGGRVVQEYSGFSGITALILTYLWTKCPSAGLIVTDLFPIQRCPHMHGMHIIHRRHAKRTLTLKCIIRIWNSGGLSVD